MVKKKRKSKGPFIATDSEWDTSLSDPWISTAFASAEHGTTVFMRDDVPEYIRARLNMTAHENDATLIYTSRDDTTNLLGRYWEGPCRLLMFFTPKDVEYAIGWERWKAAIEAGDIRQRNNLSGNVDCVHLKDIVGWAGKTKLVKFAEALGIPMVNKSSMDKYKSCMWTGLMESPEEWLRYAIDDARVLLQVHREFISLFNTVQRECLGMGETVWTEDDIPMTVGSLVAKTFERWLYSQAGPDEVAMKFCVRKLGILDPDARAHKKDQWAFISATKRYKTMESLSDVGEDFNWFMDDARFMFTALDGSGIRWWRSRPSTESRVYNALVQGGRCLNENPFEYRAGPGLDVDIAGCYGSSLRGLIYPVGLPYSFSRSPNDEPITFGKWLDRFQDELIDGFWCATVSGLLEYQQDLIFSKLAKVGDIIRNVAVDDESDVNSDFVMLRKQIENGVITSDVLKVLRAVCSNSEWAGIKNLEIVTAAAYLKSDRRAGVKEWSEDVLRHNGSYGTRKNGDSWDSRSRAWYGVPLEGFIGRLVDRRREYKHRGKDKTVSEDERVRYAGLDSMLKLIVNTLYGDFASRYFSVGNSIMGNVITAKARVGVWMLAKALGLRQCITDGGIYTPGKVCYWRGKKPGLDILSRQWEWRDAKNQQRGYTGMRGQAWDEGDCLNPPSNVDELAMMHVDDFWKPYGLKLEFQLEHKARNSFASAAYWSKSDYALNISTEGPVYALRGKEGKTNRDRKTHPSYTLLDRILDGSDVFPESMTYSKGGLLKVGKYQIIQNSNGYENLRHLRRGDDVPAAEHEARYNNTHFPMMDNKDFEHRRNRKKVDHGEPAKWFEKFAPQGISRVHTHMADDKLRPLRYEKVASTVPTVGGVFEKRGGTVGKGNEY